MKLDIDKIRHETPGVSHCTHLLASGSALMPQPVVDAVIDHTMLEARIGGYEAHAARAVELDNVYKSIAKLLDANQKR